jgi:hypothetical protein
MRTSGEGPHQSAYVESVSINSASNACEIRTQCDTAISGQSFVLSAHAPASYGSVLLVRTCVRRSWVWSRFRTAISPTCRVQCTRCVVVLAIFSLLQSAQFLSRSYRHSGLNRTRTPRLPRPDREVESDISRSSPHRWEFRIVCELSCLHNRESISAPFIAVYRASHQSFSDNCGSCSLAGATK